MIETIATALVAGASAGGALFGLLEHFGKRSFDHKCDEALAKYKEELKRETDSELLRLSNDLKAKSDDELARLNVELKKQADGELTRLSDQLRGETDGELTRLNAQLQRVNAEQNVRFSRMFDRTADAIVEAHRSMVELGDKINKYFQAEPPQKNEWLKHFDNKWRKFESFFTRNRIYIPRNTAEQIQDFCIKLDNFKLTLLRPAVDYSNPQECVQREKDITEMNFLFPQLLDALEDQFQEILGIPVQKTKGTKHRRPLIGKLY